jgi:hypothetical protein
MIITRSPPRRGSSTGGLNVNDVESDSPGGILMHLWTDTQLTPNVDRFADTHGDSVTLWHDSIGLADVEVNLRVCSVALDQAGRFRIINGTGTGAGIRSLGGQFTLRGLFSFDLVRQHRYGHDRAMICPLAFLSPHQVVRDIVRGSGLPRPTFDAVDVQGRADLVRVHPVHIFAPTASPAETAAA